ncbi:MAG: LLM class F420-dependent oxidoreductase [Actinomycetota bacterium]
MELGLHLGALHARLPDVGALASEAERLGFDSVWAGEAYGNDAATVAAFAAARTSRVRIGTAVMQIPARTPAMTAMTALTLDDLSGGRFILGLGMSGPRVIEGWHGQPFDHPLTQTREHVALVRRAIAREAPLTFEGERYRLPLGGTEPLRSTLYPLRTDLPIYLASTGPRNVALAGEIADGWMPIFFAPAHAAVLEEALAGGLAQGGRDRADISIAPMVPVAAGPDLETCRTEIRRYLALYLGGMGSRRTNFYANLVRRYGYEEVDVVQERFLAGERDAAAEAVPEGLIDELALVGPAGRIRERLDAWSDAGVHTMICLTQDPAQMAILAEAFGR